MATESRLAVDIKMISLRKGDSTVWTRNVDVKFSPAFQRLSAKPKYRDIQALRVQPLGCLCPNTQAKACTPYTCNPVVSFFRKIQKSGRRSINPEVCATTQYAKQPEWRKKRLRLQLPGN